MTSGKYVESDKYQKEIQQQYKKRVAKFTPEEVIKVLQILDIPNLPISNEITEARAGNMNATYITPHLVIKMNKNRKETDYVSNKIISDRLGNTSPVVKVIAYDNFEKTDFEVLVMEKSEGNMLLDDIFEMNEKNIETIFNQVLDVVDKCFEIPFQDFGLINSTKEDSFETFSKYLEKDFDSYVAKIKSENICTIEDIEIIEKYFKKHISIFDQTESVFVNGDLHMGNILHKGEILTAVIDFDYSLKAPKVRVLLSIIGFIDNPQQFVEGTKDFDRFKGKNFYYLLPMLKARFPEIFADPQLLRKLNLIEIKESIKWVSQNWSADWNTEMINGLLQNEIGEDYLSQTYHGKILSKYK